MNLITLDYETYYDTKAGYSLKTLSIEDYVTDPRFQIMCVGVKINNEKPISYAALELQEYKRFLIKHGVHKAANLHHNSAFDAFITQHCFGFLPPMLLDTMGMAQAMDKPRHKSVALAACLKRRPELGVQKGDAVLLMDGRRMESLSLTELQTYMKYCRNDCEGEYQLFVDLMKRGFPREELYIIDLTLRMYLDPKFQLDSAVLQEVLSKARKEKEELLGKLPVGLTKDILMSNVKLAKLLKYLGIEPPIKISLTTGKQTLAFAKTDPQFIDLQEQYEDDPLVGPILAARLGVKSTIAETRSERLLNIAHKRSVFRVPIRYYAAHTGRYGGSDGINPQNLPRIPEKPVGRGHLRYALRAPPGCRVISADLAQIEARLNAWLAGVEELLNVFRTNGDPYSTFASYLFRKPIIKGRDDKERFLGKTCILGLGYGMGPAKLIATLRKDKIKIDHQEAQFYVSTYRDKYHEIPELWDRCDTALKIIKRGDKFRIGPCIAQREKVLLPNGMALEYPNLKWVNGDKYIGWMYEFSHMPRTIWGGKLDENIIQSLARIVIMKNMLSIHREIDLHPVLQAHDELVYIVPEKEVETYMKEIHAIMTAPPQWAPTLPVAVSIKHGETYGDAK